MYPIYLYCIYHWNILRRRAFILPCFSRPHWFYPFKFSPNMPGGNTVPSISFELCAHLRNSMVLVRGPSNRSGSPREIRTRPRWIVYIRVAVYRTRTHMSAIYIPHYSWHRPFSQSICMHEEVRMLLHRRRRSRHRHRRRCPIVIFTIIIKYMFPTLACAPHYPPSGLQAP